MSKARKKPVEIEFLTFDEVLEEIKILDDTDLETPEGKIISKLKKKNDKEIIVETLNGKVIMDNTDYLCIGVNNELYPCKIDIFNKTYDIIERGRKNEKS